MSRRQEILELCQKVQRELKLADLPIDGGATDGTFYKTIQAMWSAELGFGRSSPSATAREKDVSCARLEGSEEHVTEATSSKQTDNGGGGGSGAGSVRWYERAYDYWEDGENCGLDDDGVLGGYGHISPVDIDGSATFLDELQSKRPLLGNEKAADCGAGIGRVTKHLLLERFESVDVVEQSPRLLQAAPKYIGPDRDRAQYLCVGLQDFFPAENSYDVVWIQWVVGHFTDVDFVKLINRCRAALRKGGLVIIKDNVVGEGQGAFKVDSADSSMTRSLGYFRSLSNHGEFKVVLERQQEGFPGEIFPVYMFALE